MGRALNVQAQGYCFRPGEKCEAKTWKARLLVQHLVAALRRLLIPKVSLSTFHYAVYLMCTVHRLQVVAAGAPLPMI